MKWHQVLDNPFLRDLPFKIELNKFGQLLMSPASNLHGLIQMDVGSEMGKNKKNGKVISECSIATSDGVKVADIVWVSDEFLQKYGLKTPYERAPEICIEIVSRSNTKAEIQHKIELYFSRGASEVWVINEKRKIAFYRPGSQLPRSEIMPKFKI
ncbi:MAG: Uma2 family endonuclease [Candidatus Sumerlaeota bacterium]|nr:Uma2 family endonuclease [Candidatus Sumerlaeota bacterium]